MPISQSLPEDSYLHILKNCCLSVWLPISLHLDLQTEIFHFGTLTVLSTPSTTGSHGEQRNQLGQSQSLERQPRTQAELNDKVHLLLETSLSRLGEMAVLTVAQKTTWKVKENEETEEYVSNKRTR